MTVAVRDQQTAPSTVALHLTVNGKEVRANVEPRLHLADFLRDHLRLTGTHIGCEHGVCGACTVLLDDIPVRSCITYAVSCDGLNIRTIEGFEDDDRMALLRETFSREHGLQCGFCTPGMLITARDILGRLPHASEQQVRVELSGNLCRCTGYKGIVNAITVALKEAPKRAAIEGETSMPVSVPAFATFEPLRGPALETSGSAISEPAAESKKGWTRVEDSFTVALPPARVWEVFRDLPLLASCLPGAELLEHDANSAKGRISVKLGPMLAHFSGAAVIERDDTTLTGRIKGAANDKRSGSRTRGELSYRLVATDDGKTKVLTSIEYVLQGILAQFSRSGVAQEVGRLLIAEFAANLNERLMGGDTSSVTGGAKTLKAGKPVSAWQLAWRAFRNRYGFSRKQ